MDTPLTIGIQGARGSSNEAAAQQLINTSQRTQPKIHYLHTTQAVLTALHEEDIDYGLFAYASSPGGLVTETQKALPEFSFTKIDQITCPIHHQLFSAGQIDTTKPVHIYSHPQAFRHHQLFLHQQFKNVILHAVTGTAIAAKQLAAGSYPHNSLVIAPDRCGDLYNLTALPINLPANANYQTTFWLVGVQPN